VNQYFDRKMEEQNKKFFADKPDDSTLSPEMREHYEKVSLVSFTGFVLLHLASNRGLRTHPISVREND